MVQWKDEYSVGSAGVDNQHKEMFRLANDVILAKGPDELAMCFLHLFRYTKSHFGFEERIMRDIGYPGLNEHIVSHTKLLTTLSDLSHKFGKGMLIKQDLEEFITSWVTEHIPLEDGKLSDFIKKSGKPIAVRSNEKRL